MTSKKGLSPLVATVLLVVFALVVGTATMSWGKNYVESIPEPDEDRIMGSSIVISIDQIDNELKEAQIKYITGRLNLDEYLHEEETILKEMKAD
ncbi:hypothetical protein GF323_03960 [Candidatus Woesearchaeota archaeon]|nr:hypothetical protein [Candidatus Woesearchaeota archaeon]